MRPIRQRLITLIALLILCPALAGPARAATTCSGTVVIGEGTRQVDEFYERALPVTLQVVVGP